MEGTNKCGACYSEISRAANYCQNCGNKESVGNDMSFTHTRNDRGQKLIFAGLIILCGTTIYHFLISMFVKITGNWRFFETVEPLSLIISLIGACVALFIAIGLNARGRRTLAIIFASIYTLIHVYWIIDRIFPDKEPFEFLKF